MSITSNNGRGHHHASDFIYASPYELIGSSNDKAAAAVDKHSNPVIVDNTSEIYVPASVSLRMTPPPLPQRNNNYSPAPRSRMMAPISSRSSSSTPPVTQAFPNTPSPIANNELKVVIEVHNEDRPSSLQQLQDMLDSNLTSTTSGEAGIPQEKDGFLSRKVGYEIERRLVKAVQVRTLRKKREKKGHYHYYPFYQKQNATASGFWGWLKRSLLWSSHPLPSDHVYNKGSSNDRRRKRRRRRKRHHRFCLKCVTSSFQSLFSMLKEPIIHVTEDVQVGEVVDESTAAAVLAEQPTVLTKITQPRALSRTATEATRTPTPKMLLDMKSGAIHWPVYQFGGQSGSGMLLSEEKLMKSGKKKDSLEKEPGRENFSLGGQLEIPVEVTTSKTYSNSKRFLSATEEDERKLIGWLQVRDPNNRKKSFLQIVNPKPEGPFRKAPWHGNVHVMKF